MHFTEIYLIPQILISSLLALLLLTETQILIRSLLTYLIFYSESDHIPMS